MSTFSMTEAVSSRPKSDNDYKSPSAKVARNQNDSLKARVDDMNAAAKGKEGPSSQIDSDIYYATSTDPYDNRDASALSGFSKSIHDLRKDPDHVVNKSDDN